MPNCAWEQRKVSDEVNSVDTGKSRFTIKDDGEYEILGSTSVIGYDDDYDYEGDFLLTARVGANAGTLYRHSGKVKITDNTVFLQGQNLDFLFYLLIRFDLHRLSFGTGQPLVKASELKALQLLMPTEKSEKERIANFFRNLDTLITLHQREQDISTGSTILIAGKNSTTTWEQRKLGDIADVTKLAGAASGKGVDFTTNKKSVTDTVMGAAKNVAEELPFVGGWLGGGRLPINSAIPDFGVLGENTIGLISGEKNKDKALANIGKEIGKPLAYLAPSYGGGQIKKTLEGLDTIHNGGDYNIDKNGNEQQKFAVEEKTPLKTLQAATFGKWSLPEAREYIEGGTKLKSVQYTTAYRQAIDSGMSGDNFRSVWANMDADNNGKIAMGEAGNALMNTSGITDAQRATLWKNIASDTQLSKYNTAEEKGLGDEYAIAYMSADTNGNSRITQTEAEAYLKQAIKDRAVQKLMYSLLVGEDSNPFK